MYVLMPVVSVGVVDSRYNQHLNDGPFPDLVV